MNRVVPQQQSRAREAIRERLTGRSGRPLSASQTEALTIRLSQRALDGIELSRESRSFSEQVEDFATNLNITVSAPKKKARRKVEWVPTTRVGQVKEGLSVMGRLQLTDQVVEEVETVAAVSVSVSSFGGDSEVSIGAGASPSRPKVEGGQAIHNLMNNGLVADGLSNLLESDQSGDFRSGVRELTVRTNGTGRQQVLAIAGAGELGANTQVLGAFKVLDGKKILKKPMDPSAVYRDFSRN